MDFNHSVSTRSPTTDAKLAAAAAKTPHRSPATLAVVDTQWKHHHHWRRIAAAKVKVAKRNFGSRSHFAIFVRPLTGIWNRIIVFIAYIQVV